MGPRNKKHKPNTPATAIDSDIDQPHLQSRNSSNSKSTPNPKDVSASSSRKPIVDTDTASVKSNRQSWYGKTGSWSAKASPVAQATRESISVAGGATSEALAEGSHQVARYMSNSLKRSSKAIPSLPSESRVNAKSIPSLPSESKINATGSYSDLDKSKLSEPKDAFLKGDAIMKDAIAQEPAALQDETKNPPQDKILDDPPLPPEPTKDTASQPDFTVPSINQQKGWWGWWSRPDDYPVEATTTPTTLPASADAVDATTTPIPPSPAVELPPFTDTSTATPPIPIDDPLRDFPAQTAKDAGYGSARSWFGMWSRAQNSQQRPDQSPSQTDPSPDATSHPNPSPDATSQLNPTPDATSQQPTPAMDSPEPPKQPPLVEMTGTNAVTDSPRQKPAGWAFWSRERREDDMPIVNGAERQVGELAVADTPSQSHPEAAQFNQERDQPQQKTKPKQKSRAATLKDASKTLANPPVANSTPASPSQSPPLTPSRTPEPAKGLENGNAAATTKPTKLSSRPANMVMPCFRETYSPAQIPTYWERVTSYVASSLRLIDLPEPVQHVAITPTLPKVRNAVAIGVHGYFPAPLIQKVLGPPTGTSIRFANHASAAVREWAEQNQPDLPCDIETVALEGEGFIADRVNTLWKLLLNWLSHLRQADLIFVACHSQGVPVAIMLVSKLIHLGCLSPTAKIGICAMAGVNLGPFADYKSRLLGAGAAAELFDFSRPGSKVSIEYAHALDVVLRHNVRITYAGSIDDQLVSLESSTFTTLTHPYVYRCVFIDGRVHAPDFMTHLVAFALKLRNLGISDHGLIRELSLPLAGSLYGGQGHSTIYDDAEVYRIALAFTLETTDVLPPAPRKGSEADDAQARRSSRGGPPSSIDAANALRRGSVSASADTGIPPTIAPFELPASGSNVNPYFLPWALRGILEEDVVKRDMSAEVRDLVEKFEDWKPVSKVLKDVRFRLEGVRSKL